MATDEGTSRRSEDRFVDEREEALDVLDLPQLYAKPTASTLLSTLDDLSMQPASWESASSCAARQSALVRRPRFKSEGLPQYLTRIVASSLAWLDDDEQRERVWEAASHRLSERSGRTAMGDLTRSFTIPLRLSASRGLNGLHVHCMNHGETPNVDDSTDLTLHEPALTSDNLGLKTWAASYLLAKRLAALSQTLPPIPDSAQVLELGSGTGLVGLAAAAVLCRRVLLTDLPAIVPNLSRNRDANSPVIAAQGGSAEVAVLDWSAPGEVRFANNDRSPRGPVAKDEKYSFPLILAADPLYSPYHPALLVNAISYHLCPGAEARVVVELPLREAYGAERREFRERMVGIGLKVVEEGEEVGFDDWGEVGAGEGLREVGCWWGVWGWADAEVGWIGAKR